MSQITGTNFENAAYGSTIYAERAAVRRLHIAALFGLSSDSLAR